MHTLTEDKKAEKKYMKFKYAYLNAMKIKRAHDIFKQLYIDLTSHKERNVGVEVAMYNLDDLFRKGVEPENYKGLSKIMKYETWYSGLSSSMR